MNSQAVILQREYIKPILSVIHGCWSIGGFAGGALVALALRLRFSPFTEALILDTVLLFALLIAALNMLPTIEREQRSAVIAFPRGVILTIGVLLALAFAGEAAGWDWSALYLRSTLKASPDTAALAFGMFAGGMALARFVGDAVVHRLGNARALWLGGIVSVCGFLFAVSTTVTAAALAGFALAGAGMANVIPILFRAAGSGPGVGTGSGIAGASTCGYIGILIAGPVIGFLSDRVSPAFAIAIVGSLVGVSGLQGAKILRRTSVPQ